MKTRIPLIELKRIVAKNNSGLVPIRYIDELVYFGKTRRVGVETKCKHCGKIKIKSATDLKKLTIKSCGCVSNSVYQKHKYKIRDSHLICVYRSIIDRCYNTKNKKFRFYGGRGVKVCKQWREDPNSFLNWAIDNGYKRGMQVDKDKIGTGKMYSPNNCTILTPKENIMYSKRVNLFTYKGKLVTTRDIMKIIGSSYCYVYNQLIINKKTVQETISHYKNNRPKKCTLSTK